MVSLISIHKALAGLDFSYPILWKLRSISIHKALAGLDRAILDILSAFADISIHKALAGLDEITGEIYTTK